MIESHSGTTGVGMCAAGRRGAGTHAAAPVHRPAGTLKEKKRTILRDLHRSLTADNARLLRTAVRQTRDLEKSLRDYPAVGGAPRACAIATDYLQASSGRFDEDDFIAYLRGYQAVLELQMGELWALRPALQFELLHALVTASYPPPTILTSLRQLAEAEWKEIFESANVVEPVLGRDPAGAYPDMDYDSRELYRHSISHLAKHSGRTEREVAAAALELAQAQFDSVEAPGRAAARRGHVGFYLIDSGLLALKQKVGYRPRFMEWTSDTILRNPDAFYLLGIEIATLLIVYALLEGLNSLTPAFIAFFLLLVPATQSAVDFMNNLVGFLVRPRALPKLDFSRGIPEHCSTMVAVPTLLLNQSQVHNLVTDLEIRYLANRDPNLFFALLTDSPDSAQPVDQRDPLVDVCHDFIDELNRKYGAAGSTPFYLLHRHRIFNESEGRWMGWERKRGKLLDFNQLLRGGFDSFPVKVGDTSIFPKIRYVITLDSDTQLPRDSAHRLIGTMAHPLNRAVIDPASKMVIEGYGILQPRIGISIQSASRSWLASIYSGQTGFDIYTRAVSDVYQDLFAEGSFTGKGIYEVDALRESLEHRFPDNTLLSHDLIEGAYARGGLVSDIELVDDYPSHFSAYSRRKHRWMRGDWQILRWILDRVPDRGRRLVANPISLVSRWKILDNLRRSLFDPATLVLLLSGWFYLPGSPLFWTAVSMALLLISAYSSLLFALLRAPWGWSTLKGWAKDTVGAFVQGNVMVLLHLVFLLHEALLATDAIARSLARVFVTKKRLLEWETAAESETELKKATADLYLEWSPWFAAAIGVTLWFFRREAIPAAAPIITLWILSSAISKWLNRSPLEAQVGMHGADKELLRSTALKTWRYFREWSNAANHWTIPDHVREDGVVAARLSPTNLGLLFNARLAALHFGYLTVPEFVDLTQKTFDTTLRLQRHRGHFLNWYSTDTRESLAPRFVSSVDSGNLVVCLWTLKQAALALRHEQPGEKVLWSGISDIAEMIASSGDQSGPAFRDLVLRSHANWTRELLALEFATRQFSMRAAGEAAWWAAELLARFEKAREWFDGSAKEETLDALSDIAATADALSAEMDFSILYNSRRKVLSVGYNKDAGRLEPSTYDLLASEARMAGFVAIAKGDVPQDLWFHLGRRHTISGGERVLVSWTGTMFEYLMPALWMQHPPETLLARTMRAAVRVQRKQARRYGRPWGVSESGCGGYEYHAFGIPDLAMKPMDKGAQVISPYSTFLALLVDPRAAMSNIHRMARLGWNGKYGYYEAVDYSGEQPEIVRSWMAHHQGMCLLAACNVLFDNVIQRYFHAEPFVLATELLLHERVPSAIAVDVEAPLQAAVLTVTATA
jgi:cyclic beta-1,2-glucan synthetase